MSDAGHIATDEMLNNLEMKIQVVYEQASKEAQEKLNKKLKQYENDLPKKKATLSKKDFETWKKNQAHIILNKQNLADSLADDLVNSDKIAASIINGHTPGVYALNYNFGTYQIESDMNMGTSFVLYDQYTVERLLEENPDLLPHVEIDPLKDKKWNKTHFNNDILQGILQGESIPDISKRLNKSIGMDKNAAVRSARTATTGAQNAGRVNSYKRAQDIGIDLQQEWMATLDGRTRHSHRAIDGERIDIGKTFSNKCHYPGDPTGPGHEVYNCRCTLVPVIKGFELSNDWKNKVIDYDAWKNDGKSKSNNKHNIVNGKDISQTWKRRPDEFDFEIEDVMNAQGFDGKPRIVSSEEFDELVKQANDGNGFIAQRTYSASDQKILDDYREQLYDGKWYVDCSTGGANYGQGMYCAADYTGKLTDGIKSEMEHYIDLNDKKFSQMFMSMSEKEQRELLPSIVDELMPDLTKTQKQDLIDFITYDRLGGQWDNTISFERAKQAREALLKSDVNIGKFSHELDQYKYSAKNYIETLTLDPSARIITYEDLTSQRGMAKSLFYIDKRENPKKIVDKFKSLTGVDVDDETAIKLSEGLMTKNYDELSKFLDKNNLPKNTVSGIFKDYMNDALHFLDETSDLNPGSRAVLLGYDAINAAGHGASDSYTVILNRTKLIIKSDDKKWLKNSFEEWLEDQAEPDPTIKSAWGDKKYSFVYNVMKNSTEPGHGADANNFFNALKKFGQDSGIGTPPKVWNAYMTGQLDAEDLKVFEDIIKKYLPKDTVEKTVKVADKIENMHYAAKASEKVLKFNKGNPMTKGEADTYKVNPLYNTKDAITTKNCQTSTFAYECRRQGYDVAALPKMVDGDNNPLKDFVDIGTKQKKLAQDQALGWINKKTGTHPTALIKHDFGDAIDKDDIIKELEKQVGKNGERYTLSVRWDAKYGGGAHVVNLDRDSNGVIRIIDNQRGIGKNGTLEKNTWTIDEYLKEKSVKNIKTLYRVDDCVPDFNYFNSIVVDAKKIKSHLPSKVSELSSKNYGKLYKAAKAKGESPSAYYTKWKYGIIDDTDLDDIFDIGKTAQPINKGLNSKINADLAKKSYAEALDSLDDNIAKEVKDIVEDIVGSNNMTYAEYWSDYAKGKIIDPELDNLLKGVKPISKSKPVSKSVASAIDFDAIKDKSASKVWKELNEAKAGGGKFWKDITDIGKKNGVKPAEAWKKYLAGELDVNDVKKIEGHLEKLYKKADDIKDVAKTAAKTDNIFDKSVLSKYDKFGTFADDLVDIDTNLYEKIQDKIFQLKDEDHITFKKIFEGYKNGEIKSKELDDLFNEAMKKINSSTLTATPSTPVVDMDLLKTKKVSKVWNELKDQGGTAYSQFWKTVGEVGKDYGLEKKQSKVWDLYINGKLKPEESKKIDDFLLKHYFKKADDVIDYSEFGGKEVYDTLKKYGSVDDFLFDAPAAEYDKIAKLFHDNADELQAAIDKIKKLEKAKTTVKTAKTAATKSDDLIKAEAKLKKAEEELKKIPNDTYTGIWKDDVTLADYEAKKGTIAAKKIWYEEKIDEYKDKIANDTSLTEFGKKTYTNSLKQFEQYLKDLDEFEQKGKEYAKLQKAVKDAQDEVYNLSPSPFQTTYSKERKDAAIYVRGSSSQIRKETNKYFAKKSKAEYDAATPAQRNAAYEYTQSYHKFNEPLRGIEYGSNEYKGVGKTDLNAKYANNGKMLNDFTDYIDKCINDKDIWLQRGCHWGGMDKFLQVDMSLLQSGTEQQLRNALLGKTVTEYGFMSCGTGRGAGFGGNVMFNIFLPKGAKATYAEVYSAFKNGSEIETIIQQGAQFTITRVDKSGGKWYIDLELSGYNPAQRWKK